MNIINLLTINEYSRSGKQLYSVNGLVWHWVANPGSTPEGNRNFFENRKDGKDGYGSAHYIIGINGDTLQCIPECEMAYHVGANKYKEEAIKMFGPYPNATTIGIELCHPTWEGYFTDETLQSLIKLSVSICKRYNLHPSVDIVRHYDITGKNCPKWFIEHEDEFISLKNKIQELV